jgi:integral membrane protein
MGSFSATTLGRFRFIAIAEGISFLLLLFVAMPLKYLAGNPLPVKYLGWAHGVLFILYCVLLMMVWMRYKWSFGKTALAFFASLVPFGTFILDRQLKKEQEL